jgi:hypothetical protein
VHASDLDFHGHHQRQQFLPPRRLILREHLVHCSWDLYLTLWKESRWYLHIAFYIPPPNASSFLPYNLNSLTENTPSCLKTAGYFDPHIQMKNAIRRDPPILGTVMCFKEDACMANHRILSNLITRRSSFLQAMDTMSALSEGFAHVSVWVI